MAVCVTLAGMFSNLIFLIIVLLLIGLAPEGNGELLIAGEGLAFLSGMLLFAATALLIIMQNQIVPQARKWKGILLKCVNLELICFLAVYQFAFGSHRIFGSIQFLSTLFSLFLYFFGLWIFYRSLEGRRKADLELRMLAPLTIPFLLFSLLAEFLYFLPGPELSAPWILLIAVLGTLLFLLVIMAVLPPLIQMLWKCSPLPEGRLRERLEAFCRKAGFTHAGLKSWKAMGQYPTAGIIGVFPRFRYVMFTPRLLELFPEEEIEAILAHEIGHSAHRHLILYPFVIYGMMLLSFLFSFLFSEAIAESLALRSVITPSIFWTMATPFIFFVPFAILVALYFRYVFGFFSRLFERQADLHGFALGISPQTMIDALDHIAVELGNIHRHPSWHHHSIDQRIRFLESAKQNRNVVAKHHRRVRRWLLLYSSAAILLSFVVISPYLAEYPVFRQANDALVYASGSISSALNSPLQRKAAKEYLERSQIPGDQQKIQHALEKSYQHYVAIAVPGVAEFHAAELLLQEGHVEESAWLMIEAWKRFDFDEAPPEVEREFRELTKEILKQLEKETVKEQLEAVNGK